MIPMRSPLILRGGLVEYRWQGLASLPLTRGRAGGLGLPLKGRLAEISRTGGVAVTLIKTTSRRRLIHCKRNPSDRYDPIAFEHR
jgi:hypothetical protein